MAAMTEERFEKFSSQFAETVCLITTRWGDKTNVMTAAWVIPVSHDPPLVLASIAPQRYTHDLLLNSREFAVNVLADDQVELSQYAGSFSGRREDKFREKGFREELPQIIKAPLVGGCCAHMECQLHEHVTAGDHTVFIGRVVALRIHSKRRPLLLRRGKYHALGEIVGSYY